MNAIFFCLLTLQKQHVSYIIIINTILADSLFGSAGPSTSSRIKTLRNLAKGANL